MSKPMFTKEELEEMEVYDREIEAQAISMDEIRRSKEWDRMVMLERMDNRQRRIAEYQREYRAANKEAIAEYQREYRNRKKAEKEFERV